MPGPATIVAAPPPPAGETQLHAGAALDRSFIRSVAWTGAAKWTGQAAAWICTILVARILTPEDYGIVGMANVFLGLVTMLSEFGIGGAVVTLRTLEREQIKQLHTFAVLSGLICFGLAAAAAFPISLFFRTPELRNVVIVLGLGFILAGLRSVPDAVLQRDLEFRRLAFVEGIQAILLALGTITLAMLGFGYWTLVIGTLFGSVISTALALWLRPYGFSWPRFQQLRGALRLGGHVMTTRVAWYAYSNADFLIAGKLLGQKALGHYNLAWSLASAPVSKIAALVMRVTPAYFSALQNDFPALKRYLLTTTQGLAVLTFPAALGLALVADDFVLVAMGEKWEGVIAPLRLLALYASLRSITPMLSQILSITGQSAFVMRNSIIAAFTLPVAFVVGSRWGTTGIATAWIVAHPLVLLPMYQKTFKQLNVTLADYFVALRPAIVGCLWMAAVVALVRVLTIDMPHQVRFVGEALGGAAAYVLVFFKLYRHRFDKLRASWRA